MKARDGILIAGGYGHVGRRIAAELAADYPGQAIVAGRDVPKASALAEILGNGVRGRRLDIHDPTSVEAALTGVSLVINCIDQREPHLLRAAIACGLAYTDITADLSLWRTALALDAEARQSGARILLGAGLIPGIANVMARAGVERAGGADSVLTALLLSLGDSFGPAALDYMLAAAAERFMVVEAGQERRVSNFSSGRPADFPAPIGRRTVYRFGLPDQVLYPQTLGARAAATRLALDPPWVTALCAGLMRLGLGWLLQRASVRRAVVRLFGASQTAYFGQDQYALMLEVTGARGIAKLSLVGHGESAATALGATLMARGLFVGEVSQPGVWLPEQVIEPGPFLERLAARGLKVTI